MGWKVVNDFVRERENNRLYTANDVFPHEKSEVEPTDEEIKLLSTNKNSSNTVFIMDDSVKEPAEDKPVEKYTKDELKVHLNKKGVPYEDDAKKEDLLALAAEGKE